MYRIISGKLKGRRILAPKHLDVRPTTDFAREALFSIIEHHFCLEDIAVLDLFSGIGSISLEFASRGCKDITAIDKNFKHCHFLSSMSKKFEVTDNIRVFCRDAMEWLKKDQKNEKQYHLIFADPPFDFSQDQYTQLVESIVQGLLGEEQIFILEHASKMKIHHQDRFDTRKYGNVSFSFFRKNKPPVSQQDEKKP